MEVSVLVPVYNGENFLQEALESLNNQIGAPRFEVIVVDDGSEDPNFVSELAERILTLPYQVIRQENSGVSVALNTGMAASRAPAICWLSHDDVYQPDRLSKQYGFWQTLPENSFLFGGYSTFGNRRGKVSFNKLRDSAGEVDGLSAIRMGLLNGCTAMWSKDYVSSLGGFSEDLRYTQDYDLWLRMYQSGVKFFFDPIPLTRTRLHSLQGSRLVSPQLEFENIALMSRIASAIARPAGNEKPRSAVLGNLSQLRQQILREKYFAAFDMRTVLMTIDSEEHYLIEDLLVSVIIPTVPGREYWLSNALRSLEGQVHRRFEVVVVVNAEQTGNLEEAYHKLGESYSFPIMFEWFDRPGSPGSCREKGVDISTGEYIAFLDDDDYFLPTKLHAQLLLMAREELMLTATDYIYTDQWQFGREWGVVKLSWGENFFLQEGVKRGFRVGTPMLMVSRDLFIRARRRFGGSVFGGNSLGEDIRAVVALTLENGGAIDSAGIPGLQVERNRFSSLRNSAAKQAVREVLAEFDGQLPVHRFFWGRFVFLRAKNIVLLAWQSLRRRLLPKVRSLLSKVFE